MSKSYQELFKHLESINPPNELRFLLLSKIQKEQLRAFKTKRSIFVFSSIFSFLLMLPILFNLSQSLDQSGFNQYVSLVFSDGAILANYWKELAWSLAESLPIMILIAFLSVLSIFVWSLFKTILIGRQKMAFN
ncbi:MAG: hypothetical protein NTW73_00500 [Candidatus Parcubacteria bacterium]|nr:hypothetical protein [Candidatus Parcubacteria bacterium]